MTTQDNNEAASASQPSTAGAAKGGNTNDEFTATLRRLVGSSHQNFDAILAHVARQRQESEAEPKPRPYAFFTPEIIKEWKKDASFVRTPSWKKLPEGTSCTCQSCDKPVSEIGYWGGSVICRPCYENDGTPSAAVAKGVDTAVLDNDEQLTNLMRAWADAAPGEAALDAYDKVMAYIAATYGAQQREAGRRERDAEIARLRSRVEELIDIGCQHQGEIARLQAALARQPVGEGLDSEEFRDSLRVYAENHGKTGEGSARYEVIQTVMEWHEAAAVPPAIRPVSEGPTEELQFLRNVVADAAPMLRTADRPKTADILENAVNSLERALSAVPPAKAEGMSDTERLDLLLNVSGFHFEIIDQQFYLLDGRGRIAGKGATKRAAIDAIRAQQAKKGELK